MQRQRRFVLDVALTFFSSLSTIVAGFLVTTVIGSHLGASDLGLFQMAYTIYGIVMLVSALGIPVATIKYVSEYKNDSDTRYDVVSSAVATSFVLGLLASVSLYILSRSIAGVFRIEELSKALKVISLIFPFATVGATLLGTLNGLRRMREYAAAVVLQSMTILAFSILAITLGYGVTGVMASYVLASIAYCAVLIYTCRNDFGLRLRRFKVTASKILAFGWKNAAANGVNLVNLSADTLLVAYFLTTRDVGYYGVAIILSRIFLAIPGAIQIITFPASSEYWARKDLKTLQTMIEKSMKYTSCILFPIAVALGLFAGGVVGLLYGTEYTQSVGPLVILVVGSATLGILGSVGGTLYGLGRPELALMGGIATASTNVTLNLLLIPLFGIIGAAFATATSFIFGTVLVSYLIQKAGHIRIDFIWHTKNGVLFVTVLALGQFLKTDKPFGAAVALVAWATYVLIMLRFLLGPEDLGLIRTSLRDLFQRE